MKVEETPVALKASDPITLPAIIKSTKLYDWVIKLDKINGRENSSNVLKMFRFVVKFLVAIRFYQSFTKILHIKCVNCNTFMFLLISYIFCKIVSMNSGEAIILIETSANPLINKLIFSKGELQ